MSIGKFLKKQLLLTAIPGALPVYMAKKAKEHGVVGAYKEELKETPGVNLIYKMGKEDGNYEGKKEGYLQASNEYEKKLLAQAKEFKEQSQLLKTNSEAKDTLMKEYEIYIEQQEKIIDRLSSEKRELLDRIKNEYNEIMSI